MKKTILKSTIAVSIFLTTISFFNKGLAFFREVLYAQNFGLGLEFNAYLVSSILPIIIYSTIYYLSQFYFVPSYNKIVANNKNEEKKFLSDNFWIFFFIGCIITLLLFQLSTTIIEFYLANADPSLKKLALKIFKIYIFTIPLSAAHSILAAYLNAEHKFAYPAISVVLLNLIVVIAILIFVDKFDIFVIPFAFVFGMTIQLVFLLYQCRGKINFNPFTILRSGSFSNVFNITLFFTLLAEVITFSYIPIDRYFIDRLGEGGVASLSYAYQVFELPLRIFTFSIATIIFSKFSRSYQTKSDGELERQFQIGIKLAIFIFTPIAFMFYFWGDSIIRILYERGRFLPNDTLLTYEMLKIYTISLVLYAAYSIINKMIYSTGLVKKLILISTLGAIVKVILSLALIDKYQQAGLAVTTSISYGVICVAGYFIIVKKLKFSSYMYPIKDIIIYTFIGFICFIIIYLIYEYLISVDGISLLFSPIIFIVLYSLTVIYLNTKEIVWLRELVKELILKKKLGEN
jgi:putative peptidoglycan lipid II flippase